MGGWTFKQLFIAQGYEFEEVSDSSNLDYKIITASKDEECKKIGVVNKENNVFTLIHRHHFNSDTIKKLKNKLAK